MVVPQRVYIVDHVSEDHVLLALLQLFDCFDRFRFYLVLGRDPFGL